MKNFETVVKIRGTSYPVSIDEKTALVWRPGKTYKPGTQWAWIVYDGGNIMTVYKVRRFIRKYMRSIR